MAVGPRASASLRRVSPIGGALSLVIYRAVIEEAETLDANHDGMPGADQS